MKYHIISILFVFVILSSCFKEDDPIPPNPKPEKEIIHRVSDAIFTNTSEIEPKTIILISIANETGLLKINFDKKKLKEKKDRIKSITKGELIGEAAKHAIQAVQAAIAVTVIIPAVTASSAGH